MPGRRATHILGAAVLALACGGTSTDKTQSGASAGSGGGWSGAAGDAATAGSAGAMGGGAAGSAGKGELVAGKGGMGNGGTGGEAGGRGDAEGGSGGDTAGASSGGGGAGGASAGAGGAEGGEGGSTAGSAGAGMAGAGAEAGNPTFPPKPFCGGDDARNDPWCSGIENVRIELTSVVDESGDGNVSPGEQLSFVFTLQNEGTGIVNTPCLGLLADDPDVEILGGEANDNPAWEWFGIAAGASVEMTLRARVGENVLAGRRIHFLAWIDVLRAGCTDGNEIQFELTVD